LAVFPADLSDAEVPAKPHWADKDAKACELLLWVRRAHRSAGVGEQALRDMDVDTLITDLWKKLASLLVRHPVAGISGEEDPDGGRWLAFSSNFGFAPDPKHPLQPDKTAVLYRCPKPAAEPNGPGPAVAT